MSTTESTDLESSAAPDTVATSVKSELQRPLVSTSRASWKSLLTLENRFLAPILISCILLVGQLTFGFLESWWQTCLAIAVAITCELVLGRLMVGKFPHLASAYISGISVGILIRSPFLWPFALCASLSIMSKYVLRWRNRHLWNPSNFGVSAMLFLYPAAVASLSIQWGNTLWPMLVVWCLGSLIISRLKRFHICLTYVISFICLAGARSALTGSPFLANVAPLTGPMYQLFVFFMITDPRTTVSTKRGQCLVAFLIALVEMILRLAEFIHAPYYALFLVGPVALAAELAMKRKAEAPGSV
ncbi:RnfABCDGE type electron transport complex subunit D [Roseiconus nitratireducens]|uniref:RnfABCDGE type electron transport complex subunit D n=1 Tax=Roseiconus nitratireducens TaxID=2605748 RepID=A0A5M6D6I8_9BACT|nr:RnfABCDGE type electron transport complex subunit D [Roseiconus nitratireducens]KAA5543154.1 RnfABCDGE type electron transport complex subunit D [Roseiconus nitratireducens]